MHPSPRGAQVERVSIALGLLATIAVVLRLLARWRSKASFAADDGLIVLSLLPQYVMLVIGCVGQYSFKTSKAIAIVLTPNSCQNCWLGSPDHSPGAITTSPLFKGR